MKCNTCGRQSQNEEANFCEYCGASFREQAHTAMNATPREPMLGGQTVARMIPLQIPNGMVKASEPMNIEKPISFINWLATYSLLFVPIAGWLAFFILLFVWAFDGKTPASKKNWARVTLIVAVILIVLFIAYMMMVFSSPMFQGMMDGTFDFNSYFNNLNQNLN